MVDVEVVRKEDVLVDSTEWPDGWVATITTGKCEHGRGWVRHGWIGKDFFEDLDDPMAELRRIGESTAPECDHS